MATLDTDRERRQRDDNGVDLTLVGASLAMTPTERLKSLENALNALRRPRER